MLCSCPAGQVCASSRFGQACSAQRDEGQGATPQRERDPYQDFVFVLQPEGKKTQTPTTLSVPADEALFSPPAFSNIYLNLSPLYPPGMQWVWWSWEVYSANLASHVPGKSIQVCLARLARGLCRQRVSGGAVVPASPGRVWGISLHLPAGSAWHLDETCWEGAHVMGGFVRGEPVLGTCCLWEGSGDAPSLFNIPPL